MERIQIHTTNCPSIEENLDKLKARLGNVLSSGPSKSSLCCCISRENEKYILNMRVHSMHGHFPLHLEAIDEENLIATAIKNIRSQFREWHKNPHEYAETHVMGSQPCTHGDSTVLKCPIGSPANKSFEEAEGK